MEIAEILKQMREAAQGGRHFTHDLIAGWADDIETEIRTFQSRLNSKVDRLSTAMDEMSHQLAADRTQLEEIARQREFVLAELAKSVKDGRALAARLNPDIADPVDLAKIVCAIQFGMNQTELAWSARSPLGRERDIATAQAVIERWSAVTKG